MFRTLGRMFVLCSSEELTTDLNADLTRMAHPSQTKKGQAMSALYKDC